MIGASDMAFPRVNAWSFWLTAFGGLLLYFSFVGGNGLYGAGNAPDVGWFAYAPLTARAFSLGHSTDFWTLGLLVSGIWQYRTAVNFITTIFCMRCPGMTLGKMPLLAWLNLWSWRDWSIFAVSPLTAAQIMLVHRPLPRRRIFLTPRPEAPPSLDAFLLDLRPSRSLHPRDSVFRFRFGNYPGLLPQTHLWLSGDGGGDHLHRVS